MSQPEQLHATQVRMALETSCGSGVALGSWCRPQMTAAAVQRDIKHQVERRSPHRGITSREVVAESWSLATSHEVGLPFLRMILKAHMVDRTGGRWTLDPESPNPTWVIETKSEAGDTAQYLGAAVEEIRVAVEERKIVRLDIKWQTLRRIAIAGFTEGPDGGTLPGAMIPTNQCSLAMTAAAWQPTPRIDDAAIFHGGQVFLTRKTIPTNYGPDGFPTAHSRAPWEVVGEVFMPETSGITDTAFSATWLGSIALWLGTGDDSLWIQSANGFVADEDLLAFDWRTRRVAFQAMADDRRAILEFYS